MGRRLRRLAVEEARIQSGKPFHRFLPFFSLGRIIVDVEAFSTAQAEARAARHPRAGRQFTQTGRLLSSRSTLDSRHPIAVGGRKLSRSPPNLEESHEQ